jgi:hypothetical protein
LRAARRLDELIKAQKQTVGLAQGTRGSKIKGARVDDKPTLAEAGIDKNLAHQARVLGAMDETAFEDKIAEARGSVARVFRRAVREVEIAQERAERRARTDKGGTVEDLIQVAESGKRFGAILSDPPWPYECWDGRREVASPGCRPPYKPMDGGHCGASGSRFGVARLCPVSLDGLADITAGFGHHSCMEI